MDSIFGGGETTSQTTLSVPPMSDEERQLIALNTQLAQKQLDNVNNLAPFQQQLLNSSLDSLKQQSDYTNAYAKLVTPEQQAQAAADEFTRSQKLGPIQDQLLQMQVDALKQGGRATDQQKADIAAATDASIAAGTGDINTQTQRGIGLISDELANSRGLRLSDSPIGSEAALLTRAGSDQVASLTKNLRAAQASAVLNYPLAVQQLNSGINLNQQSITQAAQNFQDQLRQQAALNRQSLFGQTASSGIGMAGIGSGVGSSTLGTLSGARLAGASRYSSGYDPGAALQGLGSASSGIGGLMRMFGGSPGIGLSTAGGLTGAADLMAFA